MTPIWKKFKEHFKSESDVAKVLVNSLREDGWDVWQEVQGPYQMDRIADIVAIRNKIVWVIEVKKSMSLALIQQGFNWVWRSHLTSICCMGTKSDKGKFGVSIARKMLREYGIGLFIIQPSYGEPPGKIMEAIEPSLHRNPNKSCVEHFRNLDPVLQDFAEAGHKGSNHWTPFADTVAQLQAFVFKYPGCSMQEAMEGINHHYASHAGAKGSISKGLDNGYVKGLKKVYNGNRIHLELVPEEIDEGKLRRFQYLID